MAIMRDPAKQYSYSLHQEEHSGRHHADFVYGFGTEIQEAGSMRGLDPETSPRGGLPPKIAALLKGWQPSEEF